MKTFHIVDYLDYFFRDLGSLHIDSKSSETIHSLRKFSSKSLLLKTVGILHLKFSSVKMYVSQLGSLKYIHGLDNQNLFQ